MSMQQDIYVAGSKNHPLMLNKFNYIPWSSHLLHYAKSKSNGKLLVKSILEEEAKQVEVDDHAIQTILMGLPEDIYVVVDNGNSAKEIWLHVQQMMKGTYIGVQEKEEKLLNELERFTSIDGESIESYYHRFVKLMNDLDRNQLTPKNIACNRKFFNILQP
ncbi:gag-pol polyprotein [Tanacetum coccineum]|uniref:Gag-pol polyprotein n=1 Tax=Tanacetum coccineum TaxID=301880 RepID=A0ABQ4XF49_9ASTR